MKKILIILGILILSFLSTLASVMYQRTNPTMTGNMCDVSADNPYGICYQDLPAGGFPFSYLYDKGAVSVIGKLGPEDRFYLGWFITDIVSFVVFFSAIYLLIRKKIFLPSPNSQYEVQEKVHF